MLPRSVPGLASLVVTLSLVSGGVTLAAVRGKKAKHVVMLERHVAATKNGLPNIQARGAVVLDEDGHDMYARDADRERPIASISKLAAVLAVMDRGLDLDGLSTITKADVEVARRGRARGCWKA